ncbi:type IV secretory system conjugative DNA transfer family protein [Streptomyces neyagawaensis]|uniref:type IV secretory system conjugative DNA transfer family protein n=2 Tax=Streptomyces neyagawaensis TaxID=42238 RepID=UPI00201D1044|nr:type IV secretory system conjugative DNA transfer family protein [Streptomyces neyagawaensis]MCL6737011.1 type IV secretory system conjugative DNA transfer family protein [Streptomyces neyagawaensis]MDE1687346.1 type IV secretory system conjugative DNA transfer family protein [Streptomyces neyagawaensis]
MRPDDRHRHPQQGGGGIPDGLLIAVLGFLVGLTLLVWSATGLAGLFAHGAWPDRVTFTRTPLAVRSLVSAPQDLSAAWPDTPAAQLSGYGLFWGLLIGQLMILLVLTVFITGTLARWRAVRAREKAARAQAGAQPAPLAPHDQVPFPPVPEPRNGTAPRTDPPPVPLTTPPGTGTEREPVAAGTDIAYETSIAPGTAPTAPAAPAAMAQPAPTAPAPTPSLPTGAAVPGAPFPADGKPAGVRPIPALLLGGAETRRPAAIQAVRDAEGPALVVTSDPVLWSDTKDARAKLGPVLLYDPAHRCDTPARLHWSPISDCEDKPTAAARATALLAPIRPTAKIDQAVAETAETLLRSYLHAAAIDSRTVRHLHRWAQGTNVQEAVRILRTNAKAAAGSAGELESALTSHPERRDIAQALTARALSALSTVNVRESCTPNRADSLVLDSFVHEGGTLYVVGDPIEDPKANPSAMPLLTALASSVVERGRRVAERSSSGRLDPPLTLVLDDVAAVAPLPQLPDLLATGTDRGLPTLALLRSREQARSRWPHAELPV